MNLPELMTAFRQVADVQTADMLNLDVPDVRNGKPIIVEALPDDYTKGAMDNFVKRAERIRNGTVDPSEDNFLKITHEARLLGTDARLLDPLAPNHEDGKLNKVVENVVKEYELANEKGIIGCQLIFSDIGTPKMSWNPEWESQYMEKGFDIYNYLKTELVKRGIPAEEIAFVHDAKSDAAREQLFKEMRLGRKKIMIGSTDKCGTGVNVQTHLVAMHHVDCPWKPSSIEQREGRGIRQGNENEEVAIYRYVTKETFDAYLWGIVENKQRFISQVMTGKAISRTCEDIDEATLNYAEIKAIATGNPLIREKMELDNEVQKLVVLKTNHERSKYELQRKVMKDFPESIAQAEKHFENVKRDMAERDKVYVHKDAQLNESEKEFSVQIHGSIYSERKEAGTAILYAIKNASAGATSTIGAFYGFELQCEKNYIGVDYLILKGHTTYKTDVSLNPVGVTMKLNHLLDGMEKDAERAKERIEDLTRNLEQAKVLYEKPFEKEEELKAKKDRLSELNALLDLERKKEESVNREEDEPTKEEVEDAFLDYMGQRELDQEEEEIGKRL